MATQPRETAGNRCPSYQNPPRASARRQLPCGSPCRPSPRPARRRSRPRRAAGDLQERGLDRRAAPRRHRLRPGGTLARGTKAEPDPERTRRRRGRRVLRLQLRPYERTSGRASVRARGLAARLRGRVLQARRGGQAHLPPRGQLVKNPFNPSLVFIRCLSRAHRIARHKPLLHRLLLSPVAGS